MDGRKHILDGFRFDVDNNRIGSLLESGSTIRIGEAGTEDGNIF